MRGKRIRAIYGHFKDHWRREWHPTPVFLPGESHRQWSLVFYSPWGHKELDRTEWLSLKTMIWGRGYFTSSISQVLIWDWLVQVTFTTNTAEKESSIKVVFCDSFGMILHKIYVVSKYSHSWMIWQTILPHFTLKIRPRLRIGHFLFLTCILLNSCPHSFRISFHPKTVLNFFIIHTK